MIALRIIELLVLQWLLLPMACSGAQQKGIWRMPDEGDPHTRTWMAFVANSEIWEPKQIPEVQRNLATIAKTIAKYENVSMLVNEFDYKLAKQMVDPSVQLVIAPIDDFWMRDSGPVFVTKDGQKAAVDFNFNGWGKKQEFARDAKVAKFVAKTANVSVVNTSLVLEGGAIEVDGQGTAIITESCTLNDNRNPKVTKAIFEEKIKALLGLEKIIWLPGINGKDITDGHTDFYARFVRPGVVVASYDPDSTSYDHAVTKTHLDILKSATDAKGRRLNVVTINSPDYSKIRQTYFNKDFAAGYVNFYLCKGAVIMPEYGDAEADKAAKEKLKKLFPGRAIEQINIDGIASGGGGIHCSTQQEPLA